MWVPAMSQGLCLLVKQVTVSKSESESHSVTSDSLRPHGLHSPWNSPGQNTGVCSLFLLQGLFPTQELIPGLPHCRRIFFYQLSDKGSPRILEWVGYPFSSGSSRPRNRTRVSCIAGGFFSNWATREANSMIRNYSMCRISSGNTVYCVLLVLDLCDGFKLNLEYILWASESRR